MILLNMLEMNCSDENVAVAPIAPEDFMSPQLFRLKKLASYALEW